MAEKLEGNDVIRFTENKILVQSDTCITDDFIKVLKGRLNYAASNEDVCRQILEEGLSCKILKPGQHWRDGKIKIVIEFEVDQSL